MVTDAEVEADQDLDDFLRLEPMEHPRISQDSQVMFGKPVIKGTRITVEILLKLLGNGMSAEQVAAEYPHITRDDVLAALHFAADYLERSRGRPVAAE